MFSTFIQSLECDTPVVPGPFGIVPVIREVDTSNAKPIEDDALFHRKVSQLHVSVWLPNPSIMQFQINTTHIMNAELVEVSRRLSRHLLREFYSSAAKQAMDLYTKAIESHPNRTTGKWTLPWRPRKTPNVVIPVEELPKIPLLAHILCNSSLTHEDKPIAWTWFEFPHITSAEEGLTKLNTFINGLNEALLLYRAAKMEDLNKRSLLAESHGFYPSS